MRGPSICEQLKNLVASDSCGRGAALLCKPEMFKEAAGILAASSSRVAVVTGFYVPSAKAPETDGPPGAAVLARAVEASGRYVDLVTDSMNLQVLEACADVVGVVCRSIDAPDEVFENRPDLLVFIERLGRASDRCYYNMRGEDISAWTAPLDGAAMLAVERGIPILAIGDGGNETGMGNFRTALSKKLPDFAECLSVIKADVAIPVDVSNWGGYALVLLLSLHEGRWLGHSPAEERAMLAAMLAAGAVDGVSCRLELSVDGLEVGIHETLVKRLFELYDNSASCQGGCECMLL